MDFEEIWDSFLEGRYLVPISIGILVIAVVVVAVVAWPQIKPKPRGQAQSLSTVVTNPTESTTGAPSQVKPVPKDISQAIATDLGEDLSKLTIHYAEPGKTDKIVVRQQLAALKWKEYTYVEQEDGTWAQK